MIGEIINDLLGVTVVIGFPIAAVIYIVYLLTPPKED
jgi:hypothetical protein